MATAIYADGMWAPWVKGDWPNMRKQLRGKITTYAKQIPLFYNNWDAIGGASDGASRLERLLRKRANDDEIVFYGHSFGAVVGIYWLIDKSAACSIEPQRLRFVLFANSVRRGIGWSRQWGYRELPNDNTKYPVTDITREWDKYSDWPNVTTSQWYPNAQENCNKGDGSPDNIHISYQNVDPDDPANRRTVSGNVTYVLVPGTVPLKMYDWFIFPVPEAKVRQRLETAYHRIQ